MIEFVIDYIVSKLFLPISLDLFQFPWPCIVKSIKIVPSKVKVVRKF